MWQSLPIPHFNSLVLVLFAIMLKITNPSDEGEILLTWLRQHSKYIRLNELVFFILTAKLIDTYKIIGHLIK